MKHRFITPLAAVAACVLTTGLSAQTTLLFDDFLDGDLATGPATNPNGFDKHGGWTSTGEVPNDVTEGGGVATVFWDLGTPNEGPTQFEKIGMTSFDPIDMLGQSAVTATFVINSVTFPTDDPVGASDSQKLDHFKVGLGDLIFTIISQGTNTQSYSLGIGYKDRAGYNTTLVGNTGFTRSEFEDGFTVEIAVDATGWTLRLPGTTVLDRSGTWANAGTTYADVFATTTFKAADGGANINGLDGAFLLFEAMRRKANPFAAELDSVNVVGVADTTAPTLVSLEPVNTATGVNAFSDLTITLSEDAVAGTGNIRIRKFADDAIVEAIASNAANVSYNGPSVTIEPTASLALGTRYYVEIDSGAIEDVAMIPYAGFSGNAIWSFTIQASAPAITSLSPADEAAGVALDRNLVVTFDTNVQLGSGTITIKTPNDAIVEVIDVASGNVTVSAPNELTIDPVGGFAPGLVNQVEIDPGAVEDSSGNGFPGITDSTTWNFTTVARILPPDTVFFDDFDDLDIGTGTGSAVNGGFTVHGTWPGSDVSENGSTGLVSWDETATIGFEHVGMTSTNPVQIVGNLEAVKATWVFTSVTFPGTTNSTLDNFKVGIGNLFWTNRVNQYGLNVGYNDRIGGAITLVEVTGIDQTELEDGFSVVLEADQTGWTLSLPGTSQGPWTGTWAAAGTTFDDVFDDTDIRCGDAAACLTAPDAYILSEAMRRGANPFRFSLDYVLIQGTPTAGAGAHPVIAAIRHLAGPKVALDLEDLSATETYKVYRDTALPLGGSKVQIGPDITGVTTRMVEDAGPPSPKAFYQVEQQ